MKTKKLLTAIVVAMLFATSLSYGQNYRPLPIYRCFNAASPDDQNAWDQATLTQDSTNIKWGGWSTWSDTALNWYIYHYSGEYNYFLDGNGYVSPNNLNTDQWFISPKFSTKQYSNVNLSFWSEDKFGGNPVVVKLSTTYHSGNPTTASWTNINSGPDSLLHVALPNLNGTRKWTFSGLGNLMAYSSDSVSIAFEYSSNTTAAASWSVDSIEITGTPAGINELSTPAELVSIYPNPATTEFTISNPAVINKVEIINIVGELVSVYENIDLSTYTVDVANLQPGIYFARILLKNGSTVSKKITKE